MNETPRPQISLTTMLALVACVAVNFWLFRVGMLWGVIALNITKHVAIAVLCQLVGLNQKPSVDSSATRLPNVVPLAEPSAN